MKGTEMVDDVEALSSRAGQLGKWFAEYADHHKVKAEQIEALPGSEAWAKVERNLERARFAYTLQDNIAHCLASTEALRAELAAREAAMPTIWTSPAGKGYPCFERPMTPAEAKDALDHVSRRCVAAENELAKARAEIARDAAADILDEVSSLLDHVGIGQVADLIRDGEYDEHEVVHRRGRPRPLPERSGWHVYDEIVCEVPAGTGSIEQVETIMATMPPWAAGWPIRAAGGCCQAVILAEREACAKVAEAEATECERVGKLHPEDSDSRGRMFARARSSSAIAASIRARGDREV